MSDLNVRVEELSPVVRRVEVDVPAERVVQVTDAVYTRLNRQVKLKGYRPGHVPRRVLEKYFADRIKSDVAREVVHATFDEALVTTKLQPVAEPTVEPEELKLGEAFRYTARVEVRPEVQLQQYKGLEVKVPKETVDDTVLEKNLEQLREAMSTLVPVEGREEAQTGDIADISYEIEFVGTGRAPQKRDEALLRVEPGLFIDGHGEKVVGQKVGESRTFAETFPSTEEVAEELRGKEAKITVTLKGLKKRELPALDDEFAKDVRGLSSLDELKAKLREDLEARANNNYTNAKREALLQALVEKNPLEVPPALVDANARRMAEDFAQRLASQGLPMGQAGYLIEDFKKDVSPRVTFDLKSHFLLDAVAEAEGVKVEADDLNKRLDQMAQEEGVPAAKVRARYSNAQALMNLATQIRNQKALERIEAEAKVTDEAAPSEATSA